MGVNLSGDDDWRQSLKLLSYLAGRSEDAGAPSVDASLTALRVFQLFHSVLLPLDAARLQKLSAACQNSQGDKAAECSRLYEAIASA